MRDLRIEKNGAPGSPKGGGKHRRLQQKIGEVIVQEGSSRRNQETPIAASGMPYIALRITSNP